MALSKKDKEDIAAMISAGGNSNDPPGNDGGGHEDVIILKGEAASDFLTAMSGESSGEEEPDQNQETPKSNWGEFGKKYFGAGG